jgi:hypothetical protein
MSLDLLSQPTADLLEIRIDSLQDVIVTLCITSLNAMLASNRKM